MKLMRILWIAIFLGACSTVQPSPLPVVSTATVAPETSPSTYPPPPTMEVGPAYPNTSPQVVEVLPTLTPDASMGSAHGILLLNGEPVKEVILFLSDLVKDDAGVDRIVSVDLNTKNRALTGPDGTFNFINIPPERYALVLSVVNETFLLMKPGTQDPLLVTIEAGKAVDLGELNYDALPLPQ